MSTPPETISRACTRCNRSKRKCDKTQPTCGRCKRLNTKCVYDGTAPTPPATAPAPASALTTTADGVASPTMPATDAGGRPIDLLHQPHPHPHPHPDAHSQIQLQHYQPRRPLQSAIAPTPGSIDGADGLDAARVSALLSERNIDWRIEVKHYFETVHCWFRILRDDKFSNLVPVKLEDLATVSPNRAAHAPSPPLTPPPAGELTSAQSGLLLLCLHLLVNMEPSSGRAFGPLYRTAKRAFALQTSLAEPSIELIQCGLMLSLFEFGHGNSTLAYRTMSETVAMASVARCLPPRYAEDNTRPITAEEEDATAVWWGLFILDQLIHLDANTQDLPLLLELPYPDIQMPTMNVLWDGEHWHTYVKRLPVTIHVDHDVGAFQRAAQASVLLNRTHLYNARRKAQPGLARVSEFADLEAAIRAQLNAQLVQVHRWESFCDCMVMCLSAILTLYSPYIERQALTQSSFVATPSSSGEISHQGAIDPSDIAQCVAATDFAIRFNVDVATSFNAHLEKHPEWLAVLAPFANITCFQSLQNLLWLRDAVTDNEAKFASIYKALGTFSQRWRLGEGYTQHINSAVTPAIKMEIETGSSMDGMSDMADSFDGR